MNIEESSERQFQREQPPHACREVGKPEDADRWSEVEYTRGLATICFQDSRHSEFKCLSYRSRRAAGLPLTGPSCSARRARASLSPTRTFKTNFSRDIIPLPSSGERIFGASAVQQTKSFLSSFGLSRKFSPEICFFL